MDYARLLVQYGPLTAWLLIAASVAASVFVARRGRGLLPRGAVGWGVWALALAVVAVCATFLGVVNVKIAPLAGVYRAHDTSAREFAFTSADDGSRHSLAEYRGKVVVLNLWATWCGPCRREMPDLEKLQRSHAGDGVVVVTVSDETAEAVRRFPGYADLHVVRGVRDRSEAASALFVAGHVARPVTHIIDRDGVLRETLVGGQVYDTFERKLRPYL